MSIQERLAELKKELPTNNPPRLVAVSKYATPAQMMEAYACGIRNFGESRIQDVETKFRTLPPEMVQDCRWHFIGHLQRNKVNKAVALGFHLIHSVDSLRLAEALSAAALTRGIRQAVLLQINLTDETQKSGFSESQIRQEFLRLLELPGLDIRGLMTIGPHTSDEQAVKSTFCELKRLQEQLIEQSGHPMSECSMGMSEDFHHAMQCGATILRIGSRIFGPPNR